VDDETGDSPQMLRSDVDLAINKVLGIFDVPAFARRGQELEQTLQRLELRCQSKRYQMLDMARMRLRQWARVSTGPSDWMSIFAESIEPFWALCEAEPPRWALTAGSQRSRRAVAGDLIASIGKFNQHWDEYVAALNLEPTNFVIDQYNRYYVLEKECMMGSSRLAARHFTPATKVTREQIARNYPALPVPRLIDAAGRSHRG
jgi:hypothetical protein